MNFDSISGYYDLLAELVFGKQWTTIQSVPALTVEPDSNVLIIGGGTGKVLSMLEAREVVYVELSGKMLNKAKKRVTGNERELIKKINFIHGDYLTLNIPGTFDHIILPFFLDCFQHEKLLAIIKRLPNHLALGGNLHIIDFKKGNPGQNLLIKGMHIFFRLVAGLESSQLKDFRKMLSENKFTEAHFRSYLGGIVFYSRFSM